MLLLSSTDHIFLLNRFDLCLPSAIWILLQYASTKPFVGMQHKKWRCDYNKLFGLFRDRIPSNEAGWLRHTHPISERTPAFPNPSIRFRLWAQQPQFFTKPAHQHPLLQTVTILSVHMCHLSTRSPGSEQMQPFATTAIKKHRVCHGCLLVRTNSSNAILSSLIFWLFDVTPSLSTFVCDEHQAPSSWRGAGCLSCLPKTKKAYKNCAMGLLDQRLGTSLMRISLKEIELSLIKPPNPASGSLRWVPLHSSTVYFMENGGVLCCLCLRSKFFVLHSLLESQMYRFSTNDVRRS